MLKRAPYFLRVTSESGPIAKWDALDQLEDVAQPSEKLYVYKIKGEPGRVHILKRGGKTGFDGSGWFMTAEYEYFPTQPADAILRDNNEWHKWCLMIIANLV